MMSSNVSSSEARVGILQSFAATGRPVSTSVLAQEILPPLARADEQATGSRKPRTKESKR